MFYGSTVEHRQGSMISDPYESRHALYLLCLSFIVGSKFYFSLLLAGDGDNKLHAKA